MTLTLKGSHRLINKQMNMAGFGLLAIVCKPIKEDKIISSTLVQHFYFLD
jgi:hypothetical protein